MTQMETAFDRRAELATASTADDVAQAFVWFLGRDVESAATADGIAGESRLSLLERLFSSSEFREKVTGPVVAGLSPQGPRFEADPDPRVLDWGARFLPLSPEGVAKLLRAPTWVSALHAFFGDPQAKECFPAFADLFSPSLFHERLASLTSALGDRVISGRIEEANGLVVRGFALDRRSLETPIAVELWIDGRFTAAKVADEFRRDLQDSHGGSGCYGFTFRVEFAIAPEFASERPMAAQVLEAGSKLTIGAASIRVSGRREADAMAQLSLQVEEAKAALQRVEKLLQGVRASSGFTLSRYDEYRRTFYFETAAARPTRGGAGADISVCVVLDPSGATPEQVEATLRSLERQSGVNVSVHMLLRGETATPSAIASRPAVLSAVDDDVALADELPELPVEAVVVFVEPGVVLEADALELLAVGARSGLAYSDSDTLSAKGGERPRYTDPQLRPGFDRDLLLQTPYLGQVAAARRELVEAALAGGGRLRQTGRAGLLLEMAMRCSDNDVCHVPKVLYHRSEILEEHADYRHVVTRVLNGAAEVTVQTDILAAPVEGAARCVWPLSDGLTAAIIIPTRDRLDLLGPCIASILAAQNRNKVSAEVVVVDNASADMATRRFLNALSVGGRIRLLEYDGPFNWSAINNQAARSVEADVLIFLNNDTVVLSPDWSDELVRQAIRPEIGAVGGRLLYEDGSLQHAGIVLGVGESLIAHEGLGERPSARGYLDRRALVHAAAAVTGACMATRRDVFVSLGGFDENRLAVEGNDIDYCLRVRRAGLTVLYDPYATLYHFESKTRGQTAADPQRLARAQAELSVLYKRWGTELRQDPYYNPHFERAAPPFVRLGPPPV